MPDGDRPYLHQPAPPTALIVCPICQQALAASDYETHLRQIHRLFAYRGVRRTLDDTVEAMLDDLLATPPFTVAWPAFVRLAGEEAGDRAPLFLAHKLGAAIARLPGTVFTEAVNRLAGLVAPGNPRLIEALVGDSEIACRHLALACLTVLRPPLDPQFHRSLRILVLDRRLPEEAQLAALATALPGLDDPLAQDLMEKLVAGLGKASSVNRLLLLEKRTGPHPVLLELRERLQEKVRMSCPRCGVHMRRPAMMQHLWNEHRLVLDGLRVRDPWGVIEEWLDAFKAQSDNALLERCRVAAAKIDPEGGLVHLRRLTLAHGVADPGAQRCPRRGRAQQAACCPWCYSLVPVPAESAPVHVNYRRGRLSGQGYEVEVDDRGVQTRLEVRTPVEVIYQGPEPERRFTEHGLALLFSAPLVLVALLLAFVSRHALLVFILLALAWVVHAVVRLLARTQAWTNRRVLDYTWRFLVPRLHTKGFSLADSAFAAGLARLLGRQGKETIPAADVMRLLHFTEPAVKRGEAPAGHLAALCRLEIERAAGMGQDPIHLVVRWLGRCFEGRLPLAFAQGMLEDWTADWWTPGNLARLRILLCDRAFEAGFEVGNLIDAGQNAPALGTVLRSEAAMPLAALRLLWSLRATRPWERLGEVHTAFEMAADDAHTGHLTDQPDVLLWREDPHYVLSGENGGRLQAARIQITAAGVWLQHVLFTDPPRVFEVLLRSSGCEMTLGHRTFRAPMDLDPLSRDLERWFRYAFHELLPQVERVLSWRSPDRAAILRAWGAVPCPSCSRYLLARVGEVGIALDEAS